VTVVRSVTTVPGVMEWLLLIPLLSLANLTGFGNHDTSNYRRYKRYSRCTGLVRFLNYEVFDTDVTHLTCHKVTISQS
jgi:hypothetical protein